MEHRGRDNMELKCEHKYKGDKAIVGFASYMFAAGFIGLNQFMKIVSKTNRLQIRQPSWLQLQMARPCSPRK